MSTGLFAREDGDLPERPTPEAPPAADSVRDHIRKIRQSEPFIRSVQIQRLLAFLVEAVLAGHEDRLKETVVGVEVFDRAPDYDCKVDPVVRVEMRRLRSKLSEYYMSEGGKDDVLIVLNKGSYVPAFVTRTPDPGLATVNRDVAPPPAYVPIDPPESTSTEPSPRKRSYLIWLLVIASAAVLFTAGLLLRFAHNSRESNLAARVLPLTGNAGIEMSPTFSPDGKQVAYSWDGNRRNFDIYVRRIGEGTPRRLTDNPAHDVHPSWSPDGHQLAFFRVSREKSEVVVVPATGGVEQVIGGVSVPASNWHPAEPEQDGASGPVWSPDGSYVLVSGLVAGRSSLRILKLDLQGHGQAITFPDREENDLDPSISPDGRYIAFTRNWGANSADVFVLAARGGQPTRITFDSADIRGVAWLDADHLVYSSERRGGFRLWSISQSGGESRPISVSAANPEWPAISPDGHWLAFADVTRNLSIWRLPLGVANSSAELEPFISSARADHSPAYSPDGKHVAFVSNRSGSWQIWTSDNDGSNIQQLTFFKGSSVGTPRWSPDSRRLVFDALLNGPSAIWLIDADRSNLHRLNNSAAREYMPSWSRDGEWIYFTSLRDGQDRLYKQRPDTGQVVLITQNFFHDAVESAHDDLIYMQRRDAGIWQMPESGGPPTPIPELTSVNPVRYWTLAGQTLYFVRQERAPRELDSLNLVTRGTTKLVVIPDELFPGSPGLAVDPGGRWLLVTQNNQLRSSIILQER